MGRWILILGWSLLSAMAMPLAAVAGPDCQCRAAGEMFNQGDLVCIHTNEGLKLARCDMSQNVTTWTIVRDSCPQAQMTPLPPGRLALAEADVASPAR